MADNYLEKRYREVFGEGSRVDPETGYASSASKRRPVFRKNPVSRSVKPDVVPSKPGGEGRD